MFYENIVLLSIIGADSQFYWTSLALNSFLALCFFKKQYEGDLLINFCKITGSGYIKSTYFLISLSLHQRRESGYYFFSFSFSCLRSCGSLKN